MTSRDDRLYVRHDTPVEQIQEFVERRLRNPYVENGNIVWNFNNHELESEYLTVNEWNSSRFLLPFQVKRIWGVMMTMLPESVRSAEVLEWESGDDGYFVWSSRYSEIDNLQEVQNQTRQALEEGMTKL
jgi:hypothetical protein